MSIMTFCSHNVCSGRALLGDSIRHHDVLLGWNSTLHLVPGDDQQNNRQVGDGQVTSGHAHLSQENTEIYIHDAAIFQHKG